MSPFYRTGRIGIALYLNSTTFISHTKKDLASQKIQWELALRSMGHTSSAFELLRCRLATKTQVAWLEGRLGCHTVPFFLLVWIDDALQLALSGVSLHTMQNQDNRLHFTKSVASVILEGLSPDLTIQIPDAQSRSSQIHGGGRDQTSRRFDESNVQEGQFKEVVDHLFQDEIARGGGGPSCRSIAGP